MTQLAPRQSAASNRAYVREQVAVRGWTEEIEAEAVRAIVARLGWNERYAVAYADGADNHHLHGHRLGHYAHAYADVTEGQALPLENFWGHWQAGDYESNEIGTWHEKDAT